MSEKNKNPHDGHRKRMREQFLKEGGTDSFPDHLALEMLLYYSTPRANTNEIAHELITKFGSLNGVFEAPYGALREVDGVGEHTAVLLKLMLSLINKYLEGCVSDQRYIRNIDDAIAYLTPKFKTQKTEKLIMICMNNTGKILNTITISQGGSDFAEVDTRKIVHEVIVNNATQVILAHNHPGGICAPSSADVKITNTISNLLSSINARLANHIIITNDDDYFSFAASPKYAALFVSEPQSEQEVAEESFEGAEN